MSLKIFAINLEFGNGLKKQLIKSSAGSMVTKAVQLLIGFFLSVLLARSLGPDGYGVYSFSFTVIMFLMIPSQIGLPQLVVREVANAHAGQNWPRMRGIMHWAVRFSLALSFVSIIAVVALLVLTEKWIDPYRRATIIAGLLLVPLMAVSAISASGIRGLQHVVIGQFPDSIIRPGFLFIFVLSFMYLIPGSSFNALKAMQLHLVAAGIALAFGVSVFWKIRPDKMRKTGQFQKDPAAWKRASYLLAMVSGLQLINNYTDIIVIGVICSNRDVGVYRVVVQLSNLVVFGLGAVNIVLQPQFARLYATGAYAKLQRLLTSSARTILVFALPPAILFVFYGKLLISWVFGPAYAIGSLALAILTIGQLFNAGMGSVGALLNMTGHEKLTVRGVAIAAAVNVFFNCILVPVFGIYGAAFATAASSAVWNILLRYYVKQRLGLESTCIGLRKT